MLSINMEDVINVINSIKSYLIAIVAILVVGVVVAIAAGRMGRKKGLVRGSALLAMLLAVTLCVNLICSGPMSTMLDLVTGKGTIEETTAAEAKELAIQIAREGIVLVENRGGFLPMASGDKLNVFGWASTAACYGGAGSGGLNDAYTKVTPLQSLKDAGIETNTELTNFYVKYKDGRPDVGMWAQDWTLPEPAVSLYTDDMIANARKFSDTAMFFIARSGGEGADIPYDMTGIVNGTYQDGTTYTAATYNDDLNAGNDWNEGDTYLDLTNRERELLDLVCANFDNVIVVVNCSNSFNLTFVENYEQIKSVLWAPSQGHVGFTALGEIVAGVTNPSGRLVDTYVRDFMKTPWWNNFGDFNYTNMDEFKSTTRFGGADVIPSFVNYVEGIYVGYRFYETAAAVGMIDYDEYVQYPFGYGLSYTTFSQTMGSLTETETTVEFDVIVTNTGNVAGKEVVQAYCDPPYNDGGIEKASANLVQFEKTNLLQPGETQTVHMVINKDDLMSYDYQRSRSYVLEAGNYTISINSDSHTPLSAQTWNVPEMIVYNNGNKRASDKTTASNLFDFAAGNVTYLSRAGGFANYDAATAAPMDFELSADKKDTFYNISNYLTAEATAMDENPDAEPVTTGAKNGLTLTDVRGLDKDDPKWDLLMDEMTLDDMNAVISLGGYQTAAVASVGKVRTNDCDGPSSINNNFTGVGSVGFPVGVVIAATFNKELAEEFGDSIGKMANEMDVSGWYAPAMNIHRTAFAGRNFEYYSEDPILSGYIAAAAVAGSQKNGVYAYMKHFAMNDQEGNRCDMLCTWSNEQAIREIYLRPFEKCVKDSDCLAVMSSFNYVGNRWAGGCKELQTDVLRGEWGFKGFVETDYFGVYGYMSADQGIRNGSDLMLVNYATETNDVRFRDTNGAKQAMRNAAKNILYVVANSRQYAEGNLNTGMSPWKVTMYMIDAALVACAAVVWFLLYRNYKKKVEQPETSGK
ncbi:MAG: glycoside hydrolase family 3 C-terminal domain-containing protein [Oscillospiraceae bacterium]|nr:glycoside hydrolase family 3 C-terminal domain-containing protein [Oscillospiraceae bacterium]